jgi:dephospho-CoA kinase
MSLKIAFMGKMCSGKSTLCNYLQELQPKFVVLSFAGKIKEIAYDLFDMKFKDRKLLQQIGSKMRDIDTDVFSKYLIKQSNQYKF